MRLIFSEAVDLDEPCMKSYWIPMVLEWKRLFEFSQDMKITKFLCFNLYLKLLHHLFIVSNYKICSPITSIHPRNCAMGDIYLHLLQDSLMEFSYDAELAGVSYGIDLHVHGIQVCIHPIQSQLNHSYQQFSCVVVRGILRNLIIELFCEI